MDPITPVSLLLSALSFFVTEFPQVAAILVIFKVAFDFLLLGLTRIRRS